ncbi:MAG TPA: hypothetical protein VI160_11520 [Gemmatimonadales bacterium]
MLQPLISPTPWPAGSSHLCARCGELTPGIPVGGLCPGCTRLLRRKSARIGRWVAMGTTLPLALYLTWTLPTDRNLRLAAAVTVLLWYALTFLIVKRTAWEWLK